MKLIDLHCDTFYELYKNKKYSTIYENNLKVDILKLKQVNSIAQFFSLFVNKGQTPSCKEEAIKIMNRFKKEVFDNSQHVIHGKCYEDIKNANGKITFFLTLEEGSILEGNLDNLYYFNNEGIKIITLTWNFPNEIGYPNINFTHSNKGLTNFGFTLIEEMNRLNILIDVSHLSDQGFYDVINRSKLPIVASHSNCRSICNHPRNLTDDMIKAIGTNGGIIGVNFYNKFLSNKPTTEISDIIHHIKHMVNVGGIDVVSLGSDFDGFVGKSELNDISEMDKLYDSLTKHLTNDDIDKIFYKNALRILRGL